MLDSNLIQTAVDSISVPTFKKLHVFPGISEDFRPWECGLSPSAIYNCSLVCRKQMGYKAPEFKWMSIKRWVTTTPGGIRLPPGVFFSIKRKEDFIAKPFPHFDKKEFVLMMFPYGNVWSRRGDVPIDEDWLFSFVDGKLILEHLMMRDAAKPVVNHFKTCLEYMNENPSQLWIHMKRRRKSDGKLDDDTATHAGSSTT